MEDHKFGFRYGYGQPIFLTPSLSGLSHDHELSEETIRKKSSTYNRMSMRVRTWGEGKTVSGKSRRILWTRSTTYIPQRRGDRRSPWVSRESLEYFNVRVVFRVSMETSDTWGYDGGLGRKKKTKVVWCWSCSREVMNSVDSVEWLTVGLGHPLWLFIMNR